MSTPLFQLPTNTPAAHPLTDEQKAARKAQALANLKANTMREIAKAIALYDKAIRSGIDNINASGDYSPAEAWATFGTDAAKVLAGSSAACQHIATVCAIAGATYIAPDLPAGVILIPRQDGTVTVA